MKQRTIVARTLQPSRLDSRNRVSENPGAVQSPVNDLACLRESPGTVLNRCIVEIAARDRRLIPLAGDWDGNGSTSIGLLDPKTGALYLRDTMVAGPPEVLDALPPLGSDGEAFVGRFNGSKHAAGGKKAASIGEAGSAVSSLELAVRRQEFRSSGVPSGFVLAAFRPESGSGASPTAYPLPPTGSRRSSGLRMQSTLTSGYTWYYTLRDEANRPSIQYHVDANGNVVPDRFFVYMGNLLVASFEYGPGTWLYYTEDHLGSIRMVTNGAGQDICEKRYYPYGYEIVDFCQAPAAGGAPLKFAGMERDSSSGIDYDHARYMASLGGRFLGVDTDTGTVGDPQSWNRYTYSGNNPLKFVDPDGLEKAWAEKVAAAVMSAGSAIQQYGASLNEGGAAGVAADATLGTAGAVVQGVGDLFNLGTSTGEAIGSGGDAFDIATAVSADVGRASGIILLVAGTAQAVGVPSTTIGATTIGTAEGDVTVPSGYVRSIAENREGVVYRPPGSAENANAFRAAGPNAQNPSGYARVYNSRGQPIDLTTGKPGPGSATHIPLTGANTVKPVTVVPVPPPCIGTPSGPCSK
jgi:RHS repeat-associated protein